MCLETIIIFYLRKVNKELIKIMAIVIKSIHELKKHIDSRNMYALKATQKEVAECIQESIDEYYKEKVFKNGTSNQPSVYQRTYKLLNSLVKTEIIKSGSTLSCQVKIDESYLNYTYPNHFIIGGVPATGRDVLIWNNQDGSHGGTVDGDWKIWDEAMRTLGGENGIMAIFISKLKKHGIPIK